MTVRATLDEAYLPLPAARRDEVGHDLLGAREGAKLTSNCPVWAKVGGQFFVPLAVLIPIRESPRFLESKTPSLAESEQRGSRFF